MSGVPMQLPDIESPACRFFRDIIVDVDRTDHDDNLVSEHTRDCEKCKDAIGQMFFDLIEQYKRANETGT